MPDNLLIPERADSIVTGEGQPMQRFHAWMETLTEFINAGLKDVVLVEDVDDFPPPRSGVINPDAGILYLVNGFVNVGTNVFDTDGNNLLVIGHNNTHDGLIYTGTGTFITADASVNTDNLGFISISGGKFLDFSGTNVENVIFRASFVTGFDDLGEVDEVANFASVITQWMDFGEGFEFTGTSNVSTFFRDSTMAASSNVGPLLEFGTSVFRTIFIEGGRLEKFASGQVAIAGTTASGNVTDQATVTGTVFAGGGSHLSNIANTDLKWRFLNNFGNGGTEDSVNHGAMTMQGNATTTPVGGGWPQKTLGTRVSGNLSRFTFNSDGTLTYVGIPTIRLSGVINCSPQVGTGANQIVALYAAVNGSVLTAFASTVRLSVGDIKSVTIPYEAELSTDDTVDLWVNNTTSSISVLIVAEKHIVDGF